MYVLCMYNVVYITDVCIWLCTLQAYGMSALPLGLIRGRRSARKEQSEVEEARAGVRARIDAIKQKVIQIIDLNSLKRNGCET